MSRWNRWTLFLLLATTLVAGCGKRRSSTYEIGIDPSWYPLQIPGQEKNVLAFSIELLVEIAKKEDLALATTHMNWNDLLWGLREKKYDAVLSTLRPYTFYENIYCFSHPYLKTGPVLIVPKASKISSPSNLMGTEVAVVGGSSAALILQKVPGLILHKYPSPPFAIEAITNLEVQAAAVDVLIAQNYMRDLYADTLKIVTGPLNDEGLRLITLHNQNPKLMERFNRGLAALKKEGRYEMLLEKWGLSPDGKPIANLDEQLQLLYQTLNTL